MKRVYRDVRFPGMTVVNHGSTRFEVHEAGRPVTCFESWELPGGRVSEAFAAGRATAYFDRMADGITPQVRRAVIDAQLSRLQLESVDDDKDHSDIFNNPENPTAEIDRLMAAERVETDPERKRRLRHNIMVLMQRESVAACVVAYLVES